MKNFDQFIAIDWSGAKSPVNTRAIAMAKCDRNASRVDLINGPWSRQKIADYIDELVTQNKRILIGIDANFGYAKDIVQSQMGKKKNAFDLWAEVEKHSKNAPNFFAGGFWEHVNYTSYFWTSGKMPNGFQMPKRQTEITCGESGYGLPESPFKLIGAKQVGKGGLAAMRMAHYLKQTHGEKIKFWPFEKNLSKNGDPMPYDQAQIVITEIYPRLYIKRAGFGNQKIRHKDDLNIILKKLGADAFKPDFHSDHDSDAIISAARLKYLCGNGDYIPQKLHTPHENNRQLSMEGWIFGVGYDKDTS
jgi:hypothetical protein